MNKKISAVLISALMVLTMFTALVPSASAAITVAPPYEFIGVVNQTPVAPEFFNISATSAVNPSILYYDLDDLAGDETLKMFTYVGDELTIGDGNLTYSTSTWVDDGNTFVAWLGEKYYVVENTTSKWIISDLIVDEDDTDDHLLRVGETLTLAEGWSVTALEIDVEGKKAWISLLKDGEEVENKVVKELDTGEAGTGYFVYEEDLDATDDTEVMNFTVETVFAGMNTNLVKINDIDLISLDTLEIKSGDDDVVEDYDVFHMDETMITIDNAEDISLAEDGIVDIMGGRFSVRVTDGKTLAAVCRILTEPGTYELIGSVNGSEGTDEFFRLAATSAINPSILFYDLDDLDGAETLDMHTMDGDELTIDEGNLTYTTSTWVDDGNTFVAWLGEKYYVVENTTSKWIISDLIVDEDDTDDHLLRVGETLTLAEGWSVTALEIDVEGKKAWISLLKDGEEVENKVVKELDTTEAGTGYFVYEEDLEATDDTEVMNFTVETVFAGMNTNLVKINDIDLISLDTLEIKSGDDDVVEDYDVFHMDETMITIDNAEDISLAEDGIVDIMGGRFAVRVTDGKTLAALAKVVIIEGDGVATATATEDETEVGTEVGTEGGEVVTEDGTPAAETPTEVPTEEPTPEEEPGFEAVFAIAGLLAVAYLVLRQRD